MRLPHPAAVADMFRWQRWRQLRARAAGRRQDERAEIGQVQQWFLLLGRTPDDRRLAPRPADLHPIFPPADVFWADPFVWTRNGRSYVFFEEFCHATRRGRIAALELDDRAHPIAQAFVVVAEPYHLSYPFLFEVEGELYMMPEKREAGRLDVYRCTDFPRHWVLERTLMHGPSIVDANLFEHAGRWWLFCAARTRHSKINETLLGFHADHPLSRHWTPHRRNPLLRDFAAARPGGRVFRTDQGRLLRPVQDCVRRYGFGLGISEINQLSPTAFSEHRIWYTNGEDAGGWRALHHLDWHAGIMAMDAQRLLPADSMQGLPGTMAS